MILRYMQFLEGNIDVEYILHADSQKGAAMCSQGPPPHLGVNAMYYYQIITLLVWVRRGPQTTTWRPPPQLAMANIICEFQTFKNVFYFSLFPFLC